jgi:hypothetical protein
MIIHPHNENIVDNPIIDEPREIVIRRSQRQKKIYYFKRNLNQELIMI